MNDRVSNGFGEIEDYQYEDLGDGLFYIHAYDCPGHCNHCCGGQLQNYGLDSIVCARNMAARNEP